jgi:rod shape-determining protein MreD
MRPLLWGLLLILALVLQATIVPLVSINGIRPDLLLIIVVSSGLLLGKEQGVGMGFFSGLLQDLASGNIFGLNVLSKMATGFVAGSLERNVFKENVLLPVLGTVLATVFNSAIMLLLIFLLGYNTDLLSAISNILYLLCYNAVVAIPVHQLVYRIAKRLTFD